MKNWQGKSDESYEASIKMVMISLFVIIAVIMYLILDNQKCWQCEIITKHTDPDYPALKQTTGLFYYCDKTEEQIREFEKSNTVADSLLIQSCKCYRHK